MEVVLFGEVREYKVGVRKWDEEVIFCGGCDGN